jgi:phytoene dehydrogenase-like protein
MPQHFSRAGSALRSDVAVVGAGISGLYCAWRLLETDPSVTVTIVERLDRTGGRLDSDLVEVAPGEIIREEEGGMRFNFGMTELMRLNAALGLCDQIVPFPMGTPDMPNRFSIRGRSFTLKDAEESGQTIWSEIYALQEQERGLSPTDIIFAVYRSVLMANGLTFSSGQTPEQWTRFRETALWHGIPMKDWQMWGLLRDMDYSEECIQMLSDTIGFAGPFKSMANAGDAFQILADFPKNPNYFTFNQGFSTLPDAIRDTLQSRHSDRVTILLSASVDSIERVDDGFALVITQAERAVNARPRMASGEAKRLEARDVVLATAAKGTQDLFHRSPALRDDADAERLWDAMRASLGMKLMKINLYFTAPWWQNGLTGRVPVRFGPNFTDLPINAVYPFYALPETGTNSTDGLPAIRDAAAALTIYCDFDNTNFWHGLQNVGPMFDSPLQRQQSKRVPQVLYPASQKVVAESRRQLAALFGIGCVPEPVLTSYRLWDGDQDFEFAYHQWRLNTEDSTVREYLSNPVKGVYVCNEAFSDMHGWVNGSIRSSDLALAKLGDALFGRPIPPLENDACQPPIPDPAPSVQVLGLWGG